MTPPTDELFGPPLSAVAADGDGWLFSLDDWPLLYVDHYGAAVNDLRATLSFAHRVWFERAVRPAGPPTIIQGATPQEALILFGGDVVAVVICDATRRTSVDVRIVDPLTGAPLYDCQVRYRQLPPSPGLCSGSGGLGR
jgi:hypothetical protein